MVLLGHDELKIKINLSISQTHSLYMNFYLLRLIPGFKKYIFGSGTSELFPIWRLRDVALQNKLYQQICSSLVAGNGLSHARRQAITWTMQRWLYTNWILTNKLRWNFASKMQWFSSIKTKHSYSIVNVLINRSLYEHVCLLQIFSNPFSANKIYILCFKLSWV